jgi:hypothetical protein
MVAISAFLFRVNIGHFVVRAVADERYLLDREALLAAVKRNPDSARINLRLATSQLIEPADPEQGLYYAQRAVALSPWDYQARQVLASAQELTGQQAQAERSIMEAVKLAPHHAELNWALGNIFIRNGKLGESVRHFRVASAYRGEMLGDSFDLLWQASGENVLSLVELTKGDPEKQLSLVKYLIGKTRVEEAIGIFNAIDPNAKLESKQSGQFIATLIAAGQFSQARALWLDLAAAASKTDPSSAGAVWNSGFEQDLLQTFEQFDWKINPNQFARIGLDRGHVKSGARSLRIIFSGIDTTLLRDQILQLVVLRPGAKYRLECFVRTEDLITPEGPRLAFTDGKNVLAASEPLPPGTWDWRSVSVDFVAPQNNSPKFISIVRIPKYSYDEPTKGSIWFDDFRLSEISRGD